MIKLIITHPKYSHISPNATGTCRNPISMAACLFVTAGIYSETSVWVTSDLPDRRPPEEVPLSSKTEAEQLAERASAQDPDKEQEISIDETMDKTTDAVDAVVSDEPCATPSITLDEDSVDNDKIETKAPSSPVLLSQKSETSSLENRSSIASMSSLSLTSTIAPSTYTTSSSSTLLRRTTTRDTLARLASFSKSTASVEPEVQVPDLSVYSKLKILGDCVPLPHEAQDEKRRNLPLFRQPHTFGKKSRLARPVMANRIESF